MSLVLHDSPKVSAASREAVLRAVAELGYRPNAAARRLAERRSRTVGVLLNDLRQPWFADMLDGLTPALYAGGKHMLLGDGRIDRMMDDTLTLMGQRAAHMLLERIEHPDAPGKTQLMAPRLEVRGSSGPAPAQARA